MRIHVGKPRNFWNSDTEEFAEHRQVYSTLASVLLAENYEFSFFEHRPGIEARKENLALDGPIYSYHAEAPGRGSYCIKRGPLPYLWHMNAQGYSGWCSLAQDESLQDSSRSYAPDSAAQIINTYRDKLMGKDYGLIPQPDATLESETADLSDFVFFPLQVNNDEVMKLSDFAQFEVIHATAAAAKENQRHLVFKRHPLCRSEAVTAALADCADNPFVHHTNGPTAILIQNARAVVLTNSSVGVQALILNTPVFAFGQSEYAHMTTRLKATADVYTAFEDDLEPPLPRHQNALAYLLDQYLVDMTDRTKIAARLKEHAQAAASIAPPEQTPQEPKENLTLTLAKALEKDGRELLDLQLSAYDNLEGEAKLRVVRLLARLARSGHFVERIIKYTNHDVSMRCIRYLTDNKDYRGVERVARAMIARNPKDLQGLIALSKALYALNNPEEGLEFAKRAAKLEHTSVAALLFYARKLRTLRALPDPDISELIEKVLQSEPDNARGLWLKADSLLQSGQITQAAQAIHAALDKEPRNPDYLKLQTQISAAGQL